MIQRALARLLAVLLLTSVVTIIPVVGSSADPAPVTTERDSIPIRGVDRQALRSAPSLPAQTRQHAGDVVGMTAPLDTRDFEVAGVTWQGDRTDVEAFVRTRDAETGRWTEWSELHAEGGPDPDSAEAASARGGTQPLITGTSDGIQVRVQSAGGRPPALAIDVIDPGTSPADGNAASAPMSSAEGVQARPSARSRAMWGADESIRKGEPVYGEVRGAVVHHTAGTNSYSEEDVPGLIRGIYTFHVESRGWNDIGYNALIDKWGHVWEGRAGGLDRAVVGAHALGVNDETFGISSLGNHDVAAPTTKTVGFLERFIAWKLGIHHIDPAAHGTIGGKWRPTVLGHRDVYSTACPGRYLEAKMDEIIAGAKERQGSAFYKPSTRPRRVDYGTGGSALNVGTGGHVTWRVIIRNECLGVISDRSSTRSGDTDLTVTWIGRMAHDFSADWAPPGTYSVELTGTDTQTGATVPGWSSTVIVQETSDSPPPACA